MAEEPKKSKPQSWWHTLPGILTAITMLITVVAGLLVAINEIRPSNADSGASNAPTPTPSPTVLTTPNVTTSASAQATLSAAASAPRVALVINDDNVASVESFHEDVGTKATYATARQPKDGNTVAAYTFTYDLADTEEARAGMVIHLRGAQDVSAYQFLRFDVSFSDPDARCVLFLDDATEQVSTPPPI